MYINKTTQAFKHANFFRKSILNGATYCLKRTLKIHNNSKFTKKLEIFANWIVQGLLDLGGRNSQKYLHQTWADF